MEPGEASAPPAAEPVRWPAPVPESAAVCPACGAFRTTHLGLVGRDGTCHVSPPRAIAAALLLISTLTPRERTTFDLLGRGYDNRSIARALEISERTAKRYVTAILSKLELESRLQAGLAALIVSSWTSFAGSWPKGRMDPSFEGR